MKSKSGRKGLATALLVVMVSTAMLTLAIGASGSALARAPIAPTTPHGFYHTVVVRPTGSNDTTNLQTAFNRCTSQHWVCTIELVKGTYYTDQIATTGFHGSFVGAGQGRTTIEALSNLASPAVTPYWAAPPSQSNPWPELFTFVGGTIGVSGMTFSEPYASPTQGWTLPTNPGVEGGNYTALESLVMVTGETASFNLGRVTMVGAAASVGGFMGDNLAIGVDIQGKILPSAWTNPYVDALPLTGTFSLTNSVFENMNYGVQVTDIANAYGSVCFSSFSNVVASYFEGDISHSQVLVCGNQMMGSQAVAAILADQSSIKSNLLPSTLYVLGNDLLGTGGANALAVIDNGPLESPPLAATLTVVAARNAISLNTSCGCYPANNPDYAAAVDFAAASLAFSANTVNGVGLEPGVYVFGGPAHVNANRIYAASVGIWVDYANWVNVTWNSVKTSGQYGIAVTDGSSNVTVAQNFVKNSGVDDLYWDQTGTNDFWYGNTYTTSSPTTLP